MNDVVMAALEDVETEWGEVTEILECSENDEETSWSYCEWQLMVIG